MVHWPAILVSRALLRHQGVQTAVVAWLPAARGWSSMALAVAEQARARSPVRHEQHRLMRVCRCHVVEPPPEARLLLRLALKHAPAMLTHRHAERKWHVAGYQSASCTSWAAGFGGRQPFQQRRQVGAQPVVRRAARWHPRLRSECSGLRASAAALWPTPRTIGAIDGPAAVPVFPGRLAQRRLDADLQPLGLPSEAIARCCGSLHAAEQWGAVYLQAATLPHAGHLVSPPPHWPTARS
jgi:hypothetical protein